MNNNVNNTITAIIPVRAGSRRLKNKNIAPFGTANLLINKIEQLKQVKEITKIVVSSDSGEMLEMAKSLGVETHKRAVEYCDDTTKSFGEVVRHIAENVDGDNIMWATCTSPLIFPDTYSRAIKEYFNALQSGYDSLASFELIKKHLWNDAGPLNYKLGLSHVVSQDLPNIYVMTFGISLAPREKMIEWNYLHGKNPYKLILGKKESADIDDNLDLAAAKAWFEIEEN